MTTTTAHAAPFTASDVDRIRRTIGTMTDTDLTDLADRARRVRANYDGVPTGSAFTNARHARMIADAVAAELANRNPAPASDPVRSFDGSVRFGAGLVSLGFATTVNAPADRATYRAAYVVDMHPRNVMVTTTMSARGTTADRVDVAAPGYGMSFDGGTPVDVILAAIAVAIGRMTV